MGQILTIIISIVTTVVSTILGFILKSKIKENQRLKREKEELEAKQDNAMRDAMICILRTHLMNIHDECMDRGSIKSKELENGILMYKAYKTLGGNGMIDHMDDEIQHLPIKD